MGIRFTCPNGHKLNVKSFQAGMRGICPHCGVGVDIPLESRAHALMRHPQPLEGWSRLFKKTFVFTGGEIVGEFLMSVGYLPGAHSPDCPVYRKIAKLKPKRL